MLYACDQEQITESKPEKSNAETIVVNDETKDVSTTSPEELLVTIEKSEKQELATNKTAIFDEFEFSTVEEAFLENQIQEQNSTEPYCLVSPDDNPFSNEESYEMVDSACTKISNRLASVTKEGCLDASLILSQCSSVNNFPVLYSEFPPLEGKTPQGKILVIGGTHGDELTSVSMVFRWIEKLNRYHSGLFHWHLAPLMNPDGLLKPGATRTNANGVDLNRNMPSNDWAENALKYWHEKTNKDERRYPGETASSEPETQWLIDEINTFKPDAIISIHAPYGIVDFDAQVLDAAPKNLGRLLLNLLGTYPGSLGNYAGINRNIPVITLELPHAWVMPSEAETTMLWEDIVAWLRNNVKSVQSDDE